MSLAEHVEHSSPRRTSRPGPRLLHDISDLLSGRPLPAALETVAERIRRELQLTAVAIDLAGSELSVGLVAAGDEGAVRAARKSRATVSVLGAGESPSAAQSAEPGRWVRISPPHGEGAASKTRGFIRVPIRAGDAPLGDFLLIAGLNQGPLGRREAVADHPCVVARRNLKDVARADLELGAIGHLGPKPTLEGDTEMVVLTAGSACDGLHIDGPASAGLVRHQADDVVIEFDYIDPPTRELAHVARFAKPAPLQSGQSKPP